MKVLKMNKVRYIDGTCDRRSSVSVVVVAIIATLRKMR